MSEESQSAGDPATNASASGAVRRFLERRQKEKEETPSQAPAPRAIAAPPPSAPRAVEALTGAQRPIAPLPSAAPPTPPPPPVEPPAAVEEKPEVAAAPEEPPVPQMQTFVAEDLDKLAPPEPEKKAVPKATGRSLRRLIDEDLEGEMEAALAQFEGGSVLEDSMPPLKRTEPVPTAPAKPEGRGKGKRQAAPVDKRTAKVLAIRGEFIFVDLGEKSEGVLSIINLEGPVPAAGDNIEVIVDRFDQENGFYVIRRPGAVQEVQWGAVEKGMIVDAIVKKVNKGGLEVTVNGIRGFMPAGQVDIDYAADLNAYLNQTLRSVITEANVSEKNLVVSRKALQQQERAEKAEATLATLAPGQIKDGVVKRVADFGAFVDIGGVDGLVHVSQMSWQRVTNPAEILSVGQQLKVVVLEFDPATKKISLGIRQLTESPWTQADMKYKPGSVVSGKISKIMEFGAFVELEAGMEGLIHISELSGNRVRRVAEVVKVGDQVEVKVLEVDRERQRISLSLKQAKAEAEEAALDAADEAAAANPEAVKKPPKKSSGSLKGGLGGNSGPLFG